MEGAGRDANPLSGYRIGKTLGIGSFGKVKIAEHILTGHKVAIKILNRKKIRSMDMEEKVKREIKILRLFMHPHIIRLYEIISGVEYCHRNMVAHRDLKPENLLLDSKCNVKIADFGLSNIMRDGHFLKTSCGSPNYAAPEVISGKLYAGPEVDVWSCGVILYALLCGTLPFDDENIPNLFKKIKGGIYTLPSHLSPSARDLIPRMLVVDPMKRITIREIREHVWFKIRLPRYLAVPPPDTAQQVKKVDEETLNDVIKMGFDKNQLIESLQNRLQNEATVAYYLLLDNRLRTTSGYLGSEFQESMDSSLSQVIAETPTSATELRQHGFSESPGSGLRQHFAAERKWALGLQSRAHPREIISEVLKALQELNVYWKKIGHYNMKCRWSPGCLESMMHNSDSFSAESAIIETDVFMEKSTPTVKFEIQVDREIQLPSYCRGHGRTANPRSPPKRPTIPSRPAARPDPSRPRIRRRASRASASVAACSGERDPARLYSPTARYTMEGAGRDANPLSSYRIGRTLGTGSFGKVKIAEHILTGHKVAIKIINRLKIRSLKMEKKVKREIKLLRLLMHPYIIRLYEVIISSKLYVGPDVDVWSCGVILYALLCGTLPFDDENILELFYKIKGGIYILPSHLSLSARDLISRMLVVDPMKRITIHGIREHVWFKIQLPRYLAVPPPDTAQQVKKLSEETLNDVLNMGFDKNLLIESLQNRLQNEATVAYYLLLDDRLCTTSGYLGSDFQESMDSSFSQVITETPTSATELQQHVFTEGTFGCLPLPCFAWLSIKIHRLVGLLPVSVLALSRIFIASPSDLKPLSAAGKPGLAERGEASWPHKPTKRA
ncbi:SNF1-related protein kinase catalytic subunit alpha KIN10 [Zea mays]|uniref:SNF1-related protein kinase catalytic subunit alpha KIN10 n=1 Tax=Zea mays TaxID=4577 RepID=A0A1D6MA76_MAIZE|nr:SNF1-related protein kinase catalytic subunit alpha KIN10 [Zea mays]